MSSLVPITGSTADSANPVTPYRRDRAATAAARNSGVPAVAGYPGAAEAAANASRMIGATGSTGVPTDRSTMPPGYAAAMAAASARVSQGNTGSDAETGRRRAAAPRGLCAVSPRPWAGGP